MFNKVEGSHKNISSGAGVEEKLNRRRGGIEAEILNLKRGFNLFLCTWKGEEHFKQKVMWSKYYRIQHPGYDVQDSGSAGIKENWEQAAKDGMGEVFVKKGPELKPHDNIRAAMKCGSI